MSDKYATEPTWTEPCARCKKPVTMCHATWEVKGPYHEGCAGYPFCCCPKEHPGTDCPVGTP